MTRSIFDPTGDETARGRSQFLGAAPAQNSNMPPAAVDGKDEGRADEDEATEDDIIAPINRDDVT
jgi:hypothetical protein